jgi:hypothetical protein
MRQITCLVAGLRPLAQTPTLPIQVAGADPGSFFSTASSELTGHPILRIEFDYTRFGSLPQTPDANPLSLHLALRALTGNPVTRRPVACVGLLLADRFTPRPTVLGMMFDPGFDSGVTDETFNRVPREGCALFLDAILQLRGHHAYDKEIAFSTVHELGHVFNLWHMRSTPNFMAQSSDDGAYGPEAYYFTRQHATFLSLADQSDFVAPGGSPWGQRGTIGPPGDDPLNAPSRKRFLRLSIGPSVEECWAFEPIELIVKLSATKRTVLPDELDPGYEAFTIWIDEPDGRRRSYRSPALYCANSGRIEVASGRPFRRDISLWGQSGGFTFWKAGLHRVFCTLRVGKSVLRSNVVEFVVKTAQPRSIRYRRAGEILTHGEIARMLFYRSAKQPMRFLEPLAAVTKDLGNTAVGESIRYSLGHSLASKARRASKGSSRQAYRVAAERVLKSALDSGRAWPCRRKRIENLLEELR